MSSKRLHDCKPKMFERREERMSDGLSWKRQTEVVNECLKVE